MAMAVGIPVGWSGQLAKDWQPGLETSSYITLLTLVTETLAFLTIGLVRPWGERVPRWIPFLGGRRIPVWAAVVPAALGSLAATAITLPMFWGGMPADAGGSDAPQGVAAWIMNACYMPLLLWGAIGRRRHGRLRPAAPGHCLTGGRVLSIHHHVGIVSFGGSMVLPSINVDALPVGNCVHGHDVGQAW
ncbi:hypothetical protein GCM10020000_82210 [Streptomyces olivoverticillatus]